jgi:hypothetical protein
MTTYSTNAFCDQSTDANFQAWVDEVFTGLVTQCGMTQTADTGQMATPCATAHPAGTSTVGYYVLRFNDTLQSTTPIFIKLDFGASSNGSNYPTMLITVGTGSNGSGTITGAMAKSTAVMGYVVGQVTSNFVSRFVYNATQGVAGMAFKIGAYSAATTQYSGLGGFYIYRTVDNTGAPTADGFHVIFNLYNSSSGFPFSAPVMAFYNANNTTWYPVVSGTPNGASGAWAHVPFGAGFTLQSTTGQLLPVYQYRATSSTPGLGITNACAMAFGAEISVGSTAVCTILGSTSLTYISVMGAFGSYTGPGNWSGFGNSSGGAPYGTFMMLWQ